VKARRGQNRRVPSPAVPSNARIRRACAAAIVVAGVFTYVNSLSNPFILDDVRSVVENSRIRVLWPLATPLSPPDETPVARRPLVNLSFAVNHALHGLDVRGYHLGNLLMHLLTALAIFGLVRRALLLPGLREHFETHAVVISAAVVAIWTVHPLNSEIINYVSQRTTALMALCYVLTMYCSVRALGRNRWWEAGAMAACAAGMACKESMATAPLLVMLFDRTCVFGSLREALRRRRTLYLGLAATWGLLAALIASGARTSVGFQSGVTAWGYLLNQAIVLADYLQLAIWPRALVVDYGAVTPVSVAEAALPGALLVVLLVAALVALRVAPRAGFLCVSFFVLLAPTSSVVPIATEVGAERRMYLPLAGLIVLLVCLVYRAGAILIAKTRLQSQPPSWRLSRWVTWTTASLVAGVCLVLAVWTFQRNREYQSPLELARVTVERRPHGRAYYALGDALFDQGRREEALQNFRRATRDFPPARFALGTELLVDGDLDAGIEELRAFIALMPQHPAVVGSHQIIASAYFDREEYGKASEELAAVVRMDPRNGRAHALLGEVRLRTGVAAEAAMHLQRAAALRPGDARVREMLGHALAMQRRFAEAEMQFRLVLELDPTHGGARMALAELGRRSAAGAW
jgi:hypothetical protein